MDKRINQVAALANISTYDEKATKAYVDGAPHLKHASLRELYAGLIVKIFDKAKKNSKVPRILDLGAGEGTVTSSFLELGAEVVAVDISESQLDELKKKCKKFGDKLVVLHEDINETLRNKDEKYDIIVANSFLHHVPDYLGMIKDATTRLKPHGQFFSFQDPLRYDTLGTITNIFSLMALFFWRIFKGDLIGGLKRRIRRSRGIYLEDSFHDNAEYHVTRNGVDQESIIKLLNEFDFNCEIVPYFSTQNSFFQPLGELFGMKNTFAVVAQKCNDSETEADQSLGDGFASAVQNDRLV